MFIALALWITLLCICSLTRKLKNHPGWSTTFHLSKFSYNLLILGLQLQTLSQMRFLTQCRNRIINSNSTQVNNIIHWISSTFNWLGGLLHANCYFHFSVRSFRFFDVYTINNYNYNYTTNFNLKNAICKLNDTN